MDHFNGLSLLGIVLIVVALFVVNKKSFFSIGGFGPGGYFYWGRLAAVVCAVGGILCLLH